MIHRALIVGLTDFGDLALLLPLSALLLVWLLLLRSWSSALWWVIAVGLCMGGLGLLKIYFYACPPLPDLRSPSGHTGFGTLVYGAFALVLAGEARGWRRAGIVALGAGLGVGIAATRVILGAHSLVEAELGVAVGVGALAVFAFGYLRRRPENLSLSSLAAAAAVLIALFHGRALHAEELLRAISVYLRVGSTCG